MYDDAFILHDESADDFKESQKYAEEEKDGDKTEHDDLKTVSCLTWENFIYSCSSYRFRLIFSPYLVVATDLDWYLVLTLVVATDLDWYLVFTLVALA